MENQTNNNSIKASGSIEENLNLRYYWHVVLERRWLVIAAFISVMILCSIYVVKAPRVYEAVGRLQIDREAENVVLARDPFEYGGREQDYLQTQYKNLTGRTLIQRVIDKLNLDKDPRYSVYVDRVKAVLSDVTVAPIRISRLVDVRVAHTEPKKAQEIANTLLTMFKDDNLATKKAASIEAKNKLQYEVENQQKALEDAERKLQEYKESIKNISVEDSQNMILLAMKQAVEQHNIAQSKAVMAEKMDQEIQDLIKNGAQLESLPAVANDRLVQEIKGKLAVEKAELESLLKKYKDGWPAVFQKKQTISSLEKSLKDHAEKLVQAIRAEAQITRSQEASMAAVVKKWEQDQLELGKNRLKYEELNRKVEIQRRQYMQVLQALKELEITINNKSNNMFIRDLAELPLKPVKPRVVLILVLGVFGGLMVGFGLAFFVNYLDDSIKTQEDVEVYLRLPFLGYVPNIKSNSVIERDLQAHVHPQSTAAESFRTIRAAVALMPKADQFHILAVTSTIPSEGKSLLVSNLAIVTAQTGLKTLLVDADLRRPSVHKTFQLHSPVGLSAYLSESVPTVDEIVHNTEVPKLDVICAGAIPSNPSELSGSVRMKQFLDEVGKRYDRIFLDCPPVSAVADPLVIAAMSDGVLFVTKFNKIRREHARKSVQRIQDAGIHLLGVVLNDIDFEGKDSYYYSYYYYQNRYYASHYKTKPEKQMPTPTPASKA